MEDERTGRLERIARHEAGHAVAAWALGLGLEYVTIVAAADAAGHCQLRPQPWLFRFQELGYRMVLRQFPEERDRARVRLEPLMVQTLAGFAVDVSAIRARFGAAAAGVVALTQGVFRGAEARRIRAELRSADLAAVAADLQSPTSGLAALLTDAYEDCQHAHKMAAFVTGDPEEAAALVGHVWARSQALVAQQWDAVCLLAERLRDERRIEGPQVAEIIAQARRG